MQKVFKSPKTVTHGNALSAGTPDTGEDAMWMDLVAVRPAKRSGSQSDHGTATVRVRTAEAR
jgi:hypothetical protein